MRRASVPVLAALQISLLAGCGGGGISAPPIRALLSPGNASILTGLTAHFTATVTGTGNTAVTWSVNGITPGNATVGTIDTSGLYTAPAVPPSPNNTVTVKAASVADSSRTATASVKLSHCGWYKKSVTSEPRLEKPLCPLCQLLGRAHGLHGAGRHKQFPTERSVINPETILRECGLRGRGHTVAHQS
jgi:hypothetical protein